MTTTALPRRRLPLDVTGRPQATPARPGTVRARRRTLRRALRLRLTDDGERPVLGRCFCSVRRRTGMDVPGRQRSEMTPNVAGLVPFDQAADRLRVTGRSDVGVREIPIAPDHRICRQEPRTSTGTSKARTACRPRACRVFETFPRR